MAEWTDEELKAFEDSDELRIATRRGDGSLRKPVIVWMVRDGDDVYVRSVNGRDASWFRGTQSRRQGHIRVSGVERDVTLIEVADRDSEIDAAYEEKYARRYASIVPSIVTPKARAATLKLVPESEES
jgi:hypothetical protein